MGTMDKSWFVRRSIVSACLGFALAGAVSAQVTSLVSADANGRASHKDAYDATLSPDGRYVGFFCYDDLLGDDPGAAFFHSDTYLRDRVTGTLERISVNSNEVQGNSYSYVPWFTPDVRYVAFTSYATNLVPGDTNGPYPDGLDGFVRDRLTGTTERISVGTGGTQGNGTSGAGPISDDGRYVAFGSSATNLVTGDTNGTSDIFLRDRVAGTTERVSVGPGGVQANGESNVASISADARYIAFTSLATNIVAGDTNGVRDIFVHDRLTGVIERVNVDSSGLPGSADSWLGMISPDGRYVVFSSAAAEFVPGDTNGTFDVFVRDRQTGTTERVSVSTGGAQASGESLIPSITPDGRFVVFVSNASDLVAGDTNGVRDTFVHDRVTGTTERASLASNGAQGSHDCGVYGPAISADGRYVAFDTRSSLAEVDTNTSTDVYVRDREYEPFESECAPGNAGVLACPCSNPPGVLGHGCDNSAGTGGALLAARGVAYLSMDSLVFHASGEPPSALSIVLQGDALVPSGTVFGQGVRCAGGTLVRLYTKTASNGGITAPDFGAGDPTVSARSTALADPIAPSESRWYLVYYRDPIVLGACSAESTFNATQTAEVRWLP